jgi:hypothetical protein
MQIGVITVDGRQVGTVTINYGDATDPLVPDLDNPSGRAGGTGTGKGFRKC